MMTSRISLLAIAFVLIVSCGSASDVDTPHVPTGILPEPGPEQMPALLTQKDLGAIEAMAAGTLVRRGPCLLLGEGPDEPVIVWEDGTHIESSGADEIAVVLNTGIRIAEGDFLKGGGGSLPSSKPISDFTMEPVPEECAVGDAVYVHSIGEVKTISREPVNNRRPKPPPPPPSPSFLDMVKHANADESRPAAVIRGIDDPREALFEHLLASVRREQEPDKPACLRQVGERMFARLSQKFDDVYRAEECRWNDGGVVLRRNDRGAMLLSARLECDGRARCAGEGARVSGNLGGEGQGYVLRPVAGGWEIRTMSVSWMS